MKNMEKVIKATRDFVAPYRVTNGKKFRLKDCDPADTAHFKSEDKSHAKELLQDGIELLASLQDMLYAQDRWALLLIFQAMDAAGKDGAIKHVMSGINPQGCEVTSFKAPGPIELDHDYMWRSNICVPERGRIGIFNRSYYEEVLVARVHPEVIQHQKIPAHLVTKNIWSQRYEDISNFEQYLSRNGVMTRKFYLNLSKDEQKRRFLERVDNPDKNWKFSASDAKERAFWKDYMEAYEDMIRNTATDYAPWYVVPADNKWFSRLVVGAAIIEALASMKVSYPKVDKAKLKELEETKKMLLAEK